MMDRRDLMDVCAVRISSEYEMNLTRLVDNDFSDFERPEHYIRHIGPQLFQVLPNYFNVRIYIAEPLESELAVQVEYDMDEQGSITLWFFFHY